MICEFGVHRFGQSDLLGDEPTQRHSVLPELSLGNQPDDGVPQYLVDGFHPLQRGQGGPHVSEHLVLDMREAGGRIQQALQVHSGACSFALALRRYSYRFTLCIYLLNNLNIK